jgi:hypothetical protein
MATSTPLVARSQACAFTVPVLLVVLGIVPFFGGIARLVSLTGPTPTADARFLAARAPVVLHVVSATVFSLLGAFQFSPALRRRWPRWHRSAGKLVAVSGLLSGLTGVWMTERYAIPPDLQGPLLHVVRLMVGAGMAAAIILAWFSILRRQVVRHEAWMIRAYALGQGAATQAFVLGPWMVLSGQTGGLTRDLLMSLAWAINLLCAEWIIRGRRAPPPCTR